MERHVLSARACRKGHLETAASVVICNAVQQIIVVVVLIVMKSNICLAQMATAA